MAFLRIVPSRLEFTSPFEPRNLLVTNSFSSKIWLVLAVKDGFKVEPTCESLDKDESFSMKVSWSGPGKPKNSTATIKLFQNEEKTAEMETVEVDILVKRRPPELTPPRMLGSAHSTLRDVKSIQTDKSSDVQAPAKSKVKDREQSKVKDREQKSKSTDGTHGTSGTTGTTGSIEQNVGGHWNLLGPQSTLLDTTGNDPRTKKKEILTVDPAIMVVPCTGGKGQIELINGSNEKLVFKLKSSDNVLYRFTPSYGFIAPSGSRKVVSIRTPGSPKEDKLSIEFAVVDDDETHPRSALGKITSFMSLTVPLSAIA